MSDHPSFVVVLARTLLFFFFYFYLFFFPTFSVRHIAITDVVGFIEDYTTFSDASIVSVLRLKDLTDIYKKEMVLHGASAEEAETVNPT